MRVRPPSPVRSAVLGGVVLFVAFLPWTGRVGILLLVLAFVPWLLAHESLLGREGEPVPGAGGPGARYGAGLRQHARTGAAFAGTFWALNLAWVPLLSLRIHETWPLAAWAGQVLLLALVGAGVGGLYPVLRRGVGLPVWLAGAGAWMTGEWARGSLLGPLRFPWSPTALPLTAEPALLQPAAWGGEWLLGVGVVALAGLLATARISRSAGPLVVAAAVAAAWYPAGVIRAGGLQFRPAVEAVLVQPALELALRRLQGPAVRMAVRRRTDSLLVAARTRGLLEAGVQGPPVVVLPETHVPRGVPMDSVRLAYGSATEDVPLLVGAFRETGAGHANALLYLPPGSDEPEAWYDKRALVPGVEWGAADGLVPGESPAPLPAPGRPGALICIESAWSGLGRATTAAGAGWLVNVTNDAWLAEEPAWTRTPAFAQHPAHLQIRSVETGRGALRLANNGLSGTVSPSGEWAVALPPHGPGVARVSVVSAVQGPAWLTTPYVAWGQRLPAAASSLILLLSVSGEIRRRRLALPVDPP